MQTPYQPHLSHFGVFCRDIERMKNFYCTVFDLQETDRGVGFTFPFTIVFLSGHADQHHQLALASSRDPQGPSTVMQISFKVQTLDHLREARRRALECGATRMRGLNHGNALSIYCMDPEDNTVEVYLDTPWYVRQPHGDPLDLEQDDAAIWAETERIVRADPSFMPVEEWSARFAARRAAAQGAAR
ncbi:VOC family protein [Pseudorhodoferax sp. Leaf267]|uniref:VOC family protein n=1 Tax=Pseudorhodoferax sp. Leaf267 TaxID=1736316 RepID=UPI0006FBEF19|nr:VOC family protein [Pseudorhodoferax sp. Leaf267]KQP22083.1 glyoxalase [Pseudorhodoferax sp. Leaf267]